MITGTTAYCSYIEESEAVRFQLRVQDDKVGVVVGKNGTVASAIRTVMFHTYSQDRNLPPRMVWLNVSGLEGGKNAESRK
jgi:hypothetical protein